MAFFVHLVLSYVLFSATTDGGYLLTTPRRWTVGAGSQICASLTEGTFTTSDSLQYKLKEANVYNGTLYNRYSDLRFPQGKSFGCVDVPVSPSSERNVKLTVMGTLNAENLNETVNLVFVEQGERTFISTDKYLYQPGQTVEFRILSAKGPKISISTEPYEEVYVSTPSDTRIVQWNDVDNTAGLVHLSFDLFKDIEEGLYKIEVKIGNDTFAEKFFEVREFVLPRFEVIITPPAAVLGSDQSVTLSLCATYTFGEPVRGNATVYLASQGNVQNTYVNLTQSKQIDGCQNFTFSGSDLYLEQNNGHIGVQSLFARAVIVEDGTGVEMYAENSYIGVKRTGIRFKDRTRQFVMKPYLPIIIEVAATYANGELAQDEPVEACANYKKNHVCKSFKTNDRGIVKFIVPSNYSGGINVRALNFPTIEKFLNPVMEESSIAIYIFHDRQYMDSMNASLTIMSSNLECSPGENISFNVPVVYVTRDSSPVELNVQVASRGQILATDKIQVSLSGSDLRIGDDDTLIPVETPPTGVVRGSLVVPVTISVQSSPTATIIVWYVREDGSVVADATVVEVAPCLPQKVSFEWSSPRVEPGDDATLMIKGASNALCSIGMVDKSVDILSAGNNNDLNIAHILPIVFDSQVDKNENTQLNIEYCLQEYGYVITDTEKPSNVSLQNIVEALHMFNEAGYAIMTNLDTAKKFCMELIMQAKRRIRGEDYFATSPPFKTSTFVPFPEDPSEFGAPPQEPPQEAPPQEEPSQEEPPQEEPDTNESEGRERSYLPETWLWLLRPLSASGELNEVMSLPDTITEWVGSAVCVHPTEGVGISPSASITTFTPFFVDLTLPSSAIRGEILPITISVFNYLQEDLPVRVFVEASPNFQFVEGETGVRELCIRSTFKAVEMIKVNLTRIGDVNITVEASSQSLSSGSCGSTSPPQRRDRFIRSLPVEPEGYLQERTFNDYICTKDMQQLAISWLFEVPESSVIDSERAWITATSDLLVGPTLENLDDLVRLPYGCGEQNMINFAPNIYILQYLDASGQTTPSIRETIIEYLTQGYQQQLNYKRFDGSYSAFGNSDSDGSSWLTAFVVKSFGQSKPYIMIDDESLQQSLNWLKGLQDRNGCFTTRGFIFHEELQGGLANGPGTFGLLTSYILAALLEMNDLNATDKTTTEAVRCIEMDNSAYPYNLALRSYGLALAKAPSARAIIDQLLDISVSNNSHTRWIMPDPQGSDHTALNVETAAYALLALITYDFNTYQEEALKIARWIASHRNGQGGFVSTQDTVVALQALAAFEKTIPKGNLDLDIIVSSPDLSHTFEITNENRLVLQRVDVPTLPAAVDITVNGVGCALLQGVLRYNVLQDSISDAFSLNVTVEYVSSEGCPSKTRNITICTSYNVPEMDSNMGIIALKLMTGYAASLDDLSAIIGDGTGNFKKFEINGQQVTLYLDRITSEKICISVRAFPEFEVGDAKPGSVSVYDYYHPQQITIKVLDLSSAVCPSP